MFELRCLGEAALRSPTGELMHFRSRKHLALLIYLALNADRAHRRERLAGLLWSDSDDSKARHSLSQALYAVRRLLNGAVRIEGEDLELEPSRLKVDVHELERLLQTGDAAAAASLYRGDFLEGFWLRGAHAYEQWASRERARVSALAREALRQSIKSARDRCEWPDVCRLSERLVQLDAFDETAYAELMRALWMMDDRAAALECYDGLKRILNGELESKPSRETEALAARIRERPVRGSWNGRRLLRESEQPVFRDPPFIGRRRQLALLAEEWDRLVTGESRTVALVGAAGIGKTRLAHEFINSLELNDVAVLRGRCYEAELSLPYGPVAEALRGGIASLDLDDVNPLWLAELARIVPETRQMFGELPQPAQLDAEGGRRRLYEGIAQALRSACEACPVILFIDDMHWADDSSLALLHYLHRRVTNGLYLLTAHRPEELAARETTASAELLSNANPRVLTVRVDRLDRSESSDLLALVMGKDRDVTALHTLENMSGGNPFFAIELARSVAEGEESESQAPPPVPGSIRSLFDRRFAALSDRAASLMQQAAFLGSRVNYDVLVAAAGLPPLEVDSALRELTRSGILETATRNVSFRHDLIREIAAQQVPEALHRSLHIRAAEALIENRGSPAEIAQHYSAAGNKAEARRFALQGAQAAEQVFALDEAADLLNIAIEHTTEYALRIELVGRLGRLHWHMREYSKARPLLQERLTYATQCSTPVHTILEAKRDLLFVDMYSSSLSVSEAADALKVLYSELVQAGAVVSRLQAEVLTALLWAAVRSFNPSLAEETIARIQDLHTRSSQPEVRWRTSRSIGIYQSYRGELDEAEASLQEAIRWAKATGDESAIVDCYVGLTTLLLRTMRRGLSEHILKVALPVAEQHADPADVAAILCNCAVCYMYLRDVDQAEPLLERVKQTLNTQGTNPDVRSSISYNLGFVANLKGNSELSETFWTEALETSEDDGVLQIRQESLAALGLLAFRRGDIHQARALAAQALRLARRGQFLTEERFGLEDLLARIRYASGHKAKALARLAELADSARDRDIPLHLTAQITRIELLSREGMTCEAKRAVAELKSVATDCGADAWIREAEVALARFQ
jgi:DNA-binding SARP family transcriptional activator